MDAKRSNRRLYLLGGGLAAILLVYLGVLYDIQVVHHEEYVSRSVRSIARKETVEAARGIITDRNGRVLVSNRSTYDLTFDTSLLKADEDPNQALLRLLELCRDRGVEWVDDLPIARQAPYVYTVDETAELYKTRFLSYLKSLEPAREALVSYLLAHPEVLPPQEGAEDETAEDNAADGDLVVESEEERGEKLLDRLTGGELTGRLLYDAGITAAQLLSWMRQDLELPEELSLDQARLVLGVRYELLLRKLGNYDAYVMAEDIDMETISLINDGNYAGAKITSSYAREYQTSYGAHILGMVTPIYAEDDMEALSEKGYSPDDRIGRGGVEAAFESYLRGVDGRRVVSTNSSGKITGEYYSKDPQPGHNVELTIDLKLQEAVEDALAETVAGMNEEDGNETRGAGMAVVKVGSGDVLALASYPTYDLANYRQEIARLSTDPARPLTNRATTGRYSPGSTFKPMMAVAALGEGVVTLTEKIRDTGYWRYPDVVAGTGPWGWWCWNRGGHGRLNITQALTASCNYFFYEMGYRLGIEKIDQYALAFGLGRTTGIEIGDDPGLLASPQEREARGGTWYGGDTVQAAIGQSDNLFTPLQMANYVATLASGGKHYDAHLLKTVKSYDNSRVVATGDREPSNTIDIAAEDLEAVKRGMHDLTTSSLAGYFQDCVVDAAAKTGTVQLGSDITNNGVFICFAPYEDPEIALALVIEQGNAGAALASTAVKVINAYFTPDEAPVTGEDQLLR